jgi:hypothetical protein
VPGLSIEQRFGALLLHEQLRGPIKGMVQFGDSFYVFWTRETERWGPAQPVVPGFISDIIHD